MDAIDAAFGLAIPEAEALGHDWLGELHILLGISRTDAAARRALDATGVTHQRILRAASRPASVAQLAWDDPAIGRAYPRRVKWSSRPDLGRAEWLKLAADFWFALQRMSRRGKERRMPPPPATDPGSDDPQGSGVPRRPIRPAGSAAVELPEPELD